MTLKKAYNLVLALVAFLPFIAAAQNSADSIFSKANDAYKSKRYEEALKQYNMLLSEDNQSFNVLYNIGNCYYRLGNIPQAILNYEKARKLNPADDDVNKNLVMANSRIIDKPAEYPEFFLYKAWRAVFLATRTDTFAILAVILLFLSALAFSWYLFARTVALRKAGFYSGLCSLVLAVVLLGLAHAQNNYFLNTRQAIATDNAVNVLSAPEAGAKELFTIHAGTKINIDERENEWIKISLPNGTAGWASTQSFSEI